ncbi:hypothetical protein [Nocardia camponoti]|nr:hypothetical protein [Nocardia camponoti]
MRWSEGVFGGCVVAMPGPDGVVEVMLSGLPALSNWDACAHIDSVAKSVESVLPK